MNERIPILYDMTLRPEWIDFALEQYTRCPDEAAHRRVLREYLDGQIIGAEVKKKTVTQLQRNVGHRSVLSPERLNDLYRQMSAVSPDQRTAVRLHVLEEATPFFADCVTALRRLSALGIKGVEVAQIYDRLVSKYGDRETVYRRVRYVLKTLALLNVVRHVQHRWYLSEQAGRH